MAKTIFGKFVKLDGEQFYKIENYDKMEDFFMTITSSSDIWNFCWAQGGVTCGRKDSDHAIFPYYTADKISDIKGGTGPYTAIAVYGSDGKAMFWEPFADLLCDTENRFVEKNHITRNIYKNKNGSKVWFEEINAKLELSFRYGWTSSPKFGIVRMALLENLSEKPQRVSVLDGCKNIMCAATTAAFQSNNSVLLDAYKQTDLDAERGLSLFSVSSIVSDKAEPNEALYANTCWFSTDDAVFINPEAPRAFFAQGGNIAKIPSIPVLKGKRPVCYLAREEVLGANAQSLWYQVFDVALTLADVVSLQKEISDKAEAERLLEADIASGNLVLSSYIKCADGMQETAEEMTGSHHRANVMFNIMRGGVFANDGNIIPRDFKAFVALRLPSALKEVDAALRNIPQDTPVSRTQMGNALCILKDKQVDRLLREYLPLTFSRRHGDPSRPWNKFSIKLKGADGLPLLNYEGNWRDIFQNWEALAFSYPEYTPSFCAVFLSSMTIDGFNPYRISRDGIDWEVPDPENPWAQFGYWGDHQVIYLLKLLEFWRNVQPESLLQSLSEERYATANVPYRLKSYEEILSDPHNSIYFDSALSARLKAESLAQGSDKRLVQQENGGEPALVSMVSKLLQIVIAKAANLVPGGGIWMNTQRPEWNDANNALAGWGLSVVTTAYLYRMLSFLVRLFADSPDESFALPAAQAECISALYKAYTEYNANGADDSALRKNFVDLCGSIFQIEREELYKNGYGKERKAVSRHLVLKTLKSIQSLAAKTLFRNQRGDGLYQSYNTLLVTKDGMEVEPLQEMLEGQVAILSSGLLSAKEALCVLDALKKSRLYESRQNSYLLYPNKDLPSFLEKNTVPRDDYGFTFEIIKKTGDSVLVKDADGGIHFNADFVNARVMREKLSSLPKGERLSPQETEKLCALYERTFCHHSFTGRSGTFYAYEGLGSIYWHMVSKLLLSVQENAQAAYKNAAPEFASLSKAYYDIRSGLSFNKSPELYGAFPSDPYSHTPYHQGAKQPGMTGQVKEEILTRWGELGVTVRGGEAHFEPYILKPQEFHADGTLKFSWCGTPVVYHRTFDKSEESIRLTRADGTVEVSCRLNLSAEQTRNLFMRTGGIAQIDATVFVKEA